MTNPPPANWNKNELEIQLRKITASIEKIKMEMAKSKPTLPTETLERVTTLDPFHNLLKQQKNIQGKLRIINNYEKRSPKLPKITKRRLSSGRRQSVHKTANKLFGTPPTLVTSNNCQTLKDKIELLKKKIQNIQQLLNTV